RVGEYLTLRLASLVLGSVAALVLVRTLQPNAAFLRVLLVASLTIFGWLLPRLLMSRARKKRLERVERQLPDAVMALANSLRGGLGLLQALNVAASETPAPLGPQLQITLRELQLGAEAEETFGRLVQRLGSKDIDIVVTAILIQRAAGGNLSEILMNVANTVRERAEIRMEIMTLTSSQRLMGNLIAALPVLVAVAFVTLNPEVGKLLFETTVGQIALGVGIAFELLGLWVIRRLVKIEV
ncbi:MAG TPA: type II secretion system F family protein, partial [Dehalococcoidia bacterium]|nr:type II secretion system F family protein [Dehalococcoidia bacterium]